MPPLLSKQALINSFGERDYTSAKTALMNAGIRFDQDIDKAISALTGSGISIAKIPSLGGDVLNEAAFRGGNLKTLINQPTVQQSDIIRQAQQQTSKPVSVQGTSISSLYNPPPPVQPTGQSISQSSGGYVSPYTEGMLKNAIRRTLVPQSTSQSPAQQTQAMETAIGAPTQSKTREQILAEAQRLATSISGGLDTLAQKGYGQTDIKSIPQNVDISQLPQQSILQDYLKQSSPQQTTELPQPSLYAGGAPAISNIAPYEDTYQKFLTALNVALQPTSEETNIQDEEARVREELRNLQLGQMQSNINVEGQPIAKPFITGQQAALEKSYGLDRLVNQSKQQTLQERLANLQARRQSAVDVAKVGIEGAKYGLERADKAVERQGTQATSAAQLAKLQAETAQTQRETSLLGLPKEMTPYEKAKLEQDTQQFGREYALKTRQANANIAESQAKIADLQKGSSLTDKQSATLDLLNLTNTILESPYLNNIAGLKTPGAMFGGFFGSAYGSNTAETLNQFNQLKSSLSLENRQKLKGSGAISDFESKTLEKSASTLGTNLPNEAMRRALSATKGALATASGLAADVNITDPRTGQTKTGQLDRAGINSAISQRYLVEYK